jgi:hypothetical protein
MNEWNIQSRSHACQACLRGFADKEHYHTLLFDTHGELARQDICIACWQAQHGHGEQDRKGYVSHWQGVYEAPPATPPEAILKENAESLLRKLAALNNPKYAPTAYILAVMLERKRILKVKEQIRREGQRIFIYENHKTGEILTIPDPNLQLNQLEQVQHDVAALLEHGLPEDLLPSVEKSVPVEPPAEAPTTAETPADAPAAEEVTPEAAAPEIVPSPEPVPDPIAGEPPAEPAA